MVVAAMASPGSWMRTPHCDISPTYISSDLLSPAQKGRITTPFIGKQRVEIPTLGGKTWGENVTNYGGIGKLPFLGKRRARDLYVSRSHRHYSSGFSNYLTNVQPYSRTSLKLSECRLNDEVLPPTFHVTFDPDKYSSKGDIPVQPYFSHTSKFEVFPRHDPDRYYGIALTQRTKEALHDYYTKLYETPQFYTVFPDLTAAILERLNPKSNFVEKCHNTRPGDAEERKTNGQKVTEDDGATNQSLGFLLGDLLTEIFQRDEDFKNPYLVRGVLITLIEREDVFGIRHMLNILKAVSENNAGPDHQDDLQKEQCYRFVCFLLDILDHPRDPDEVKLQHVKQLLYDVGIPDRASVQAFGVEEMTRTDLLQLPGISGTKCDSDPPSTTTEDVPDKDAERAAICREVVERRDICPETRAGLPQYTRYLNHIVPETLREPYCSSDNSENSGEVFPILKQFYHKPTEPRLAYKEPFTWSFASNSGRNKTLPPYPSLCSRLHPTGYRINDRIGLKYKMEAHRRYHEMFPDSVPDLRDSHVTRKKYFFYGYHASAFRG